MTSVSVLAVERVATRLTEAQSYELCPIDLDPGMLQSWICWPLFYTADIEWPSLLKALKVLEQSYPLLCGRLAPAENGRHCIRVDPDEDNGFIAVEIRVDTDLVGMRCSERMVAGPGPSEPLCMTWPFYLNPVQSHPVLSDTAPLFGVHLTHLNDGCIFSVALRHLVCDGERMVQLLADIGRAYRDIPIAARHFDRSFYWPDSYISQFDVPGHTAEMYPRHITAPAMPEVEMPPLSTTLIHCPQKAIDRMKKSVEGKLQGVPFLSTNDLVCALHWLFKAECKSTSHPVTSSALPIHGTSLFLSVDVRSTSVPVIPQNYFGNATAASLVTGTFRQDHLATFTDALAQAASLIRQRVHDIRQKHDANLEAILFFYRSSNSTGDEELSEMISIAPSYAKMAFDDIDFGSGGPIYAYTLPPFPPFPLFCSIGRAGAGDGVLLYMIITQEEREILEKSAVFRECAPDVQIFPPELTTTHAAEILGITRDTQ